MFYNQQEYIRMAEVENIHWWYKCLHELVYDYIVTYYSKKDILILDAACGTGGLIDFLMRKGFMGIYGFDLSNEAVSICKDKGYNVCIGDIKDTGSIFPNDKYDVVISNDSLYYFHSHEEQKEVVKGFHAVLKRSGILILNLPAFNIFGGIHDVAVGIQYRFSKKDITRLFTKEMFTLERCFYWPFLISPLIFMVRIYQRLKMNVDSNFTVKSDIDLPKGIINTVVHKIVKFEKDYIKWKPFGSSLFVVVKKRNKARLV